MAIIVIITIILFLVLIGWTWSNMEEVEKEKKAGYIFSAIVVMILITTLIFSISSSGVEYEKQEMINPVRLLLVAVFTAINGFVVIQYIGKIIGRINNQSIDREEAKKKITLVLIIFLVVAIIECMYMKKIQLGILNMYKAQLMR